MPAFIPDGGDLIWLQFDPQVGHEQAGHRPAVVLSPRAYNRRTSLALVCPVTSKSKGYPFEVVLRAGMGISGVVLADQVRCVDWRGRNAKAAGKLPPTTLEEIRDRVAALIGR